MSVTRIDWAIGTFQLYKTPGADGVYPALLQRRLEDLRLPLTKLYRTNIAIGHVPTAWKSSKVAFLPKPGREGYTAAKDFRQISLTLFILKALEKLVERFVRDAMLPGSPLHRGQHAFQTGCSVDIALHSVVTRIEWQLEQGGYVVDAFLDIEDAFSNNPLEVISREILKCGVPRQLVDWIRDMLRSRCLETNWGESSIRGTAPRAARREVSLQSVCCASW